MATTELPPGYGIDLATWVEFWDGMRIIAALACLVLVGTVPFALAKPEMSWHQRARFIGLALIGVPIIGAYLAQLGQMPIEWWRTLMIVAGSVLAAGGTAGFLAQYRKRKPPHVPRPRHRRR